MRVSHRWLASAVAIGLALCVPDAFRSVRSADTRSVLEHDLARLNVGPLDCPQWAGNAARNHVSNSRNLPTTWEIPRRDADLENPGKLQNVRWVVPLGSQTYGTPVVANGRVFIGTNNGGGYLKRFPADVDLGCMLCFDELTGKFLWQHSNRKLPSGRVHDWPLQGIVAVPLVDGDRLWYVTNRGEVVCLDTAGFHDGENDGPFQDEEVIADNEADIVWKLDMMAQLGTRQHNMCTCSVTAAGNALFVVTGNGVDEGHLELPAPDAPSFLALDRRTGQVLWTDNSPGKMVLHGQWSSPSYAVLGGQPQVLMGGGDGWLYSFDPAGNGLGGAKLLWKFDCNSKEAKWQLGGRGTRCEFLSLPVIYDEKVYVALGADCEHGEGPGTLWCIDPTKKLDGSDVSPTLVFDAAGQLVPRRRYQACDPARGEVERPNPNSAALWRYTGFDLNNDGELKLEEQMHRSCGNPAIHNNLLFIADFSGIVHCLHAQTGVPYWTYDLFSASWAASPLIADGKVFIGDEDGDIAIFELSPAFNQISEINMGNSLYTSAVAANNRLYIASRTHLWAIESVAVP